MSDLHDLVPLQQQLFAQDAGVYGTHVDLDWPSRHGHADLSNLVDNDSSIVLIATAGGSTSGRDLDTDNHDEGAQALAFLVGYVSTPTPTRDRVDFAVLRSLFVDASHRGRGIGSDLCRRFVQWAVAKGCVEAQVSAYAANEGAQRFYQQHGFVAQSIQRTRSLVDSSKPQTANG